MLLQLFVIANRNVFQRKFVLLTATNQHRYSKPVLELKGQMHHHDDLGSKCAYTCHLSNKTTCKSVLLSTPQIWLMKVSKKLA